MSGARTALGLGLALALTGCWVLADERQGPIEGAVFPHADGYDAPELHGVAALGSQGGTCERCHAEAGEVTPTCTTCHETYPHPEGWIAGAVHGEGTWGAGGSVRECNACHEYSGLQTAVDLPCDGCHASFPHGMSWEISHDTYTRDRGSAVAVCGPCHGEDLAGGSVDISCTECHADYPHAADWASPEAHGVAALADSTSCLACHSTDGSGGSSGVDCSLCHTAWPHSSRWDEEHLGVAGTLGEGPCLDCHEPGDGPATMVATCARSCHGGG